MYNCLQNLTEINKIRMDILLGKGIEGNRKLKLTT